MWEWVRDWIPGLDEIPLKRHMGWCKEGKDPWSKWSTDDLGNPKLEITCDETDDSLDNVAAEITRRLRKEGTSCVGKNTLVRKVMDAIETVSVE